MPDQGNDLTLGDLSASKFLTAETARQTVAVYRKTLGGQ